MKSLFKKVSSVVCCAVLCLSLNIDAFAANASHAGQLTKLPLSEQSESKSLSAAKHKTITITDKNQIAKIAGQQSLNDPDLITKITYDFFDSSKTQGSPSAEDSLSSVTHTKTVYNVKDLGSGFSYWDDYDSSIYDGPANVTKTYERTNSSSFTCDVSVKASLVSSAVGFTIGKDMKVKEAYSFTVPANHQIELRVLTNYQMKSFDVGDDAGGLLYYEGSGTAQRPVGLIFQQIQR